MPKRWCNSAELRKSQIESGLDITFCDVFVPLYLEKIQLLQPKNLLEIGCGTGHLSKALRSLSSQITAIEPSVGMFEVASEVLADTGVQVLNLAACDLKISTKFDLIFSHLVAHVVEHEDDFFQSAINLLDDQGHFLFSIPHPCFFNEYKGLFGSDYHYMQRMHKNITFNITNDPLNFITEVPYHHRPLSDYINSLSRAGFVLKEMLEIFPSKEVQNKYGADWNSPRYCLFVCMKLKSSEDVS